MSLSGVRHVHFCSAWTRNGGESLFGLLLSSAHTHARGSICHAFTMATAARRCIRYCWNAAAAVVPPMLDCCCECGCTNVFSRKGVVAGTSAWVEFVQFVPLAMAHTCTRMHTCIQQHRSWLSQNAVELRLLLLPCSKLEGQRHNRDNDAAATTAAA